MALSREKMGMSLAFDNASLSSGLLADSVNSWLISLNF